MISENQVKQSSSMDYLTQENDSKSSLIPKIPWPYYAVTIFFASVNSFDIGIPRIVMLLLSSIIFIMLFIKAMENRIYALMALIVYIPYSKAIAGNLGGMITGLNYTSTLMIIAIVSGAYSKSKESYKEPELPLEQTFRWLLFLFCVIAAFSVIHADIVYDSLSFGSAIVDYKRWLDPFLVFVIFSFFIRKEEDGRLIVYLMVLSLVVVGIGSIWERRELEEHRSHLVRFSGLAGQANTMGAFFANYVFMIIGFLLYKGDGGIIRKSLYAWGVWGCLFGLFATESRGDALAFVTGLLLFLFLRNKWLFMGCTAGLIFLALNIQFLPAGLKTRVEHTIVHQNTYGLSSGTQLDKSAQTRLALWSGAIRMIESHPLTGVGYKMFNVYSYQYVSHNDQTSQLALKGRDGHNAYLMIGAEMGLPALLIFLLLLLYMFRIAFRSYRATPDPFWRTVSVSGFGSITSLVVSNLFGSRVVSLVLAGYLWALMAILLKVPIWAKERSEKSLV